MGNEKTILLWSHDDLLSFFLERFLVTQESWKVINVSIEKDLGEVIQVLDSTRVDVLIIQLGDHAIDPCIPNTLQRDYPELKVVTLSLNNNLMEVYSKQNIVVQTSADFISVVEGDLNRIISG